MTLIRGKYESSPADGVNNEERDVLLDIKGRLRVALDSVAGAAGLALDATLAAMSAKLPAALGRLAAASSMSVALSTEDKACLAPPGSHTAITPSDSTDLTTAGAGSTPVASIGLLVTSVSGGSSLAVRGTTTSSTTVTIPVVAGQYVYGSFSRVMAATTCTVVGLAP
jgi:hypothetical protein